MTGPEVLTRLKSALKIEHQRELAAHNSRIAHIQKQLADIEESKRIQAQKEAQLRQELEALQPTQSTAELDVSVDEPPYAPEDQHSDEESEKDDGPIPQESPEPTSSSSDTEEEVDLTNIKMISRASAVAEEMLIRPAAAKGRRQEVATVESLRDVEQAGLVTATANPASVKQTPAIRAVIPMKRLIPEEHPASETSSSSDEDSLSDTDSASSNSSSSDDSAFDDSITDSTSRNKRPKLEGGGQDQRVAEVSVGVVVPSLCEILNHMLCNARIRTKRTWRRRKP